MRHKLSHPMFPLCKPGRKQHNNDSLFTDQRSNTQCMCSCLSFTAGQAAIIPPIPLPFLYLSLSLSGSQKLADKWIPASLSPKEITFYFYVSHEHTASCVNSFSVRGSVQAADQSEADRQILHWHLVKKKIYCYNTCVAFVWQLLSVYLWFNLMFRLWRSCRSQYALKSIQKVIRPFINRQNWQLKLWHLLSSERDVGSTQGIVLLSFICQFQPTRKFIEGASWSVS